MAFWMDPFIMLACGIVIAYLAKRWFHRHPHFVYVAGALTMLVTYIIAGGLFVNWSLLEPIWTFLGADSGTEFMIDGIILPIAEPGMTYTDLGPLGMGLSIVIFAVYPAFLALGVVLGRLLYGSRPDQEGLVGLVRA